MKNQVNILPPRKTNKSILNDPNKVEIYKLSGKGFRITLLESLVN